MTAAFCKALFSLELAALLMLLLVASCGNNDSPELSQPLQTFAITIDPNIVYQEMIGFGGALTWYSPWLTNTASKNQIYDLIFDDLGIDIIRFKTWYYPDGYPDVTSTAVMTDDNSKIHYDATNELYQEAKARNPDVKILLSSWGPPAGLKSNNSSREGTLKKDDDRDFMYDAYAGYWAHTLDNLPFNPDYISIQNEPTYINPGWTTCQWSAIETPALPDYHIAFDEVHDQIMERPNPPVMIGPESADISSYVPFASALKDKDHCGVLAYHPYNINASTSQEQIVSGLQGIGNLSAKPNLMTEYSDNLTWFNTAWFIQSCLLHANSSGYIYWKLAWAEPTGSNPNAAMVSVSNTSSAFTVTPFYYVIKHFAKHIDAGYHRIQAATSASTLSVTAFRNPDGNQLTLVLVNIGSPSLVDFSVTGAALTGILAYQSKESSFYSAIQNTAAGSTVLLPALSITTVVLNL